MLKQNVTRHDFTGPDGPVCSIEWDGWSPVAARSGVVDVEVVSEDEIRFTVNGDTDRVFVSTPLHTSTRIAQHVGEKLGYAVAVTVTKAVV